MTSNAKRKTQNAKLTKVLIANRGEIALRIIRACRDLGIATVAVYSEADRTALHVRMADEAYYIGPPPARESYLRGDAIIAVAKQVGADAIHPGYGFLAENAGFAQAVTDAGLIFIGPPATAMQAMGGKVAARQRMQAAGVPIVPGTIEEVRDPEAAQRIARDAGYPVLIKASEGGGGKGQRVVHDEAELANALEAAGREAASSFGYAGVYIEKYLSSVRHIEIQVVADNYGNVIHLGERECSLQRRRQKIVEEAPSAVMTPDLRQRMGAAAVAAAKAVGYQSLGTVEFLVTPQLDFYFLEMNTRLQVEHPVTELVTGLDLVTLQLRLAAGEELSLKQEDIQIRGHAIEARVSSEDAAAGFMPSIGKITAVQQPTGPGVRLDSALTEGYEVSLYYDPMLAKLITWGESREQATKRLRRALAEFQIEAIEHNLRFLHTLISTPEFAAAAFDTGWVEANLDRLIAAMNPDQPTDGEHEAAAIVAAFLAHQQAERSGSHTHSGSDNTQASSNWRRIARMSNLRR